jgi:hypothetical protein
MKLSNNAMILDEKLPSSEKDKNTYLTELRKNFHVKEFFGGESPNISDLPELNQSLKEAREDKIKELSEAKQNAKDESSTNSLRDPSELCSREKVLKNNTFKENYSNDSDYKGSSNDSDYKLNNSLLHNILEFLKDLFS